MVSFDATKSTLQETVEPLRVLLDEVVVEFGDTRVEANGVDPAEVAMVDLTLSDDAFEAYNGDNAEWGLDLEQFGDVVGMADSTDGLSVTDADDGRLVIETAGLTYTMAPLAAESVRGGQEIPEMEWDAELTIGSDALQRGVEACGMVSDHLTFEVEGGSFRVAAAGDTDSVEFDTDEEPDVDVEFETDPSDCAAIYSLTFIELMIGVIPDETPVSIKLGNDFPVVIVFPVADGAGEVTYAVAPRIQQT